MKGISPETIAYACKGGVERVAGWLEDGAMSIALVIDDIQRRHGIHGGTAEIGVHHGKFFILLASLLRDGERGVAVDVFEDQEFNLDLSGNGNQKIFEANLRRHLGDRRQVDILKADSLELSTADVVSRAGHIRIFSVDGCHTRQHTFNDITKASEALASGGVIMVDDIFNTEWRGVLEGTLDALAQTVELAPIITGHNKLVLCRSSDLAMYVQELGEALQRTGIHSPALDAPETTRIGTHEVMTLELPCPGDLLMERVVSLPTGSSVETAINLHSGFSVAESWGVWTDGSEAALTIEVGNIDHCADYRFRVYADAYYSKRSSKGQVANFFVNGDYAGTAYFNEQIARPYRQFSVPGSSLRSGKNEVLVHVERPTSPASEGVSDDPRKLGLALRRIEIYRRLVPDEWYHRRATR